jgi:NOL1/NOP2/sun family putative RNA methylase
MKDEVSWPVNGEISRAEGVHNDSQFRAYFEEYKDFIPDFGAFLSILSQPHKRAIRINTLKTSVKVCKARLERSGAILRCCGVSPHFYVLENLPYPGNTLEFSLGYFHTQALSSALAVLALDPQPEERILDLCAAPGSKTSYLAQLMENRGLIVANEKNPGRIAGLQYNLARLGVTNVVVTKYPGEGFPPEPLWDRVLVDAPCSGEGRHRSYQRAPLSFSDRVRKHIPHLQKRLLLAGFDRLKPGGMLLYSTCTYNPLENEAVVAHLLAHRPARLLPITLELQLEQGLTCWRDMNYGPQLKLCRRLYPHRVDSVGFFMAKVVKSC